MSVESFPTTHTDLDYYEERCDLAAAFRWSARLGMNEGIANHFSAAVSDDGRIIACDVNEEWTGIAQRYWREAGVDHKIELRIAPALETLDSLIDNALENCFDFAFIDADKTGYKHYYERAIKLVRPGGLIAVDNTLWNGNVADPENQTEDTHAIRELNRHIHADTRVDVTMLPIGDGLTLALKR